MSGRRADTNGTIESSKPMFAVRLSHDELANLLENVLLSDSIFKERAIPIDSTSKEHPVAEQHTSGDHTQISCHPNTDRVFLVRSPTDLGFTVSSLFFEDHPPFWLETPRQPTPAPTGNQNDLEEEDEEDEEEEVSTGREDLERKESEAGAGSKFGIGAGAGAQTPNPVRQSGRPAIVFTLDTLPLFNMTKIICCFSVRDRLGRLSHITKHFRKSVYQPQCFRDVSFFPVVPDKETGGVNRVPKILNVHSSATSQLIRTGITYVEVCMASSHPFVTKVAKYGGMWNFKAELWSKVDWPKDLVIESLQLSLDPNTDVRTLDLCDELPVTSKDKISNLFLIKFEIDGPQPAIMFPTKLQGVGLQSFTSTAFTSTWWKYQIQEKRVFESILFLVLSCCDFHDDELQQLISKNGCARVEHLSLRYVKWDGVIDIPATLVSLGWFPDSAENHYRLKHPNLLWQLQTRLSENVEASIAMLNRVHESSPDLRRISFEFIRGQNASRSGLPLNVDDMKTWGYAKEEEPPVKDERFSSMTIVVDPLQWNDQPGLKEVFLLEENQFVGPLKANFLDCPKWSNGAQDFITMTARRKLLLR